MSTKDKFIELAEEAIEIIKEVINDTKEENQLVDVNYVRSEERRVGKEC